jgi:hypothetical protein
LQRILACFRKPACCDDCCNSCDTCNSVSAPVHAAPKAAEPIGAPKEQPKAMPKGAGLEQAPLKIGNVAAPQLDATPVSETKIPY